MNEKRIVKITFKSIADFRARFVALWQNQDYDEIYDYEFLCPEAEKEFEKIIKAFE